MLSLLGNLVEIFLNIPEYILYAIETVINLFFLSIQGLLLTAVVVLPGLPETVTPPEYLEEINWWFPLGGLLAVVAPLLSAYVIFLGVRWIFNKAGEL
jgi:hypothetical protein